MIDLKKVQNRYKIISEEDCHIIPGKYGEIYWHSEDRIAVQVNSKKLMTKVSRLKNVKIFCEGDYEGIYLFPLEMLDTVAEIIKARKRRQVSEKERERLAQIGFRKKK